jgi:hypothetical protein
MYVCIPSIVARQRLGNNLPIVVKQRLGRNITAVTNTHATIEELLDALFSMRPPSALAGSTSSPDHFMCRRKTPVPTGRRNSVDALPMLVIKLRFSGPPARSLVCVSLPHSAQSTALCRMVDRFQRFGAICCLHLQGSRLILSTLNMELIPERWYPYI